MTAVIPADLTDLTERHPGADLLEYIMLGEGTVTLSVHAVSKSDILELVNSGQAQSCKWEEIESYDDNERYLTAHVKVTLGDGTRVDVTLFSHSEKDDPR